MVEEKKKSNIFLALILSMLTALAGGILFGIIYGIGYYIYLLALGEIILATGVYFKFAQKTKWFHTTFAIVWCVVWTFVFNVFAVVVCEALFITKDFGITFIESYKTVINLWQTNAEIKAYMNARVAQIAGMILLGGIVFSIYYAVGVAKAKKARKNDPEQIENQPVENKKVETVVEQKAVSENKSNAENIYSTALNDCKTAILNYAKSKDQDAFKLEVKEIKAKHLSTLDAETKESISTLINTALSKEDINNLTKKANETLLKIIK